jgi:formamidopyrimidine-DNA glycosylase
VPELPEVETVVRELRPLLVGRRIAAVRSSRKPLRKRWQKQWVAPVVGSCIESIDRRGKWILVNLDPTGLLVLHLGMTGQLCVHARTERAADHTHLFFALDDGDKELRFRDIRRFGSVTWHPHRTDWEATIDERLGPEPFDLDARYWREALARTSRCLKAVLLDQCVVAGVGNIYADESLHLAKLDPRMRGERTTFVEANRLRKAIVAVLSRAIESRGSSIRNYVGGSGLMGEYQNEFRAYGRTGKPCVRCRTAIACIRLAGRATHFCPNCQRERSRPIRG